MIRRLSDADIAALVEYFMLLAEIDEKSNNNAER
jgi:hypothetical protein